MKKIYKIATLFFLIAFTLSQTVPAQNFDFWVVKPGGISPPEIATSITKLSATTLPRSGRLKITGTNFGAVQGMGLVKIGGVESPVSSWSANSITAYVPETTAPGAVNVQVFTASSASNVLSLNVTTRQAAAGRVKWRFQADDYYIAGRPGIGPDGTIYALGILGHLYALTPDGGLKWIFNGYGSTQSVSVGSNGTIYFSGLNVIYAINPNGTLKWKVTDPSGAGVDVGPTVGPDGNIYAVTNEAGLGGLGAMAISPAGNIIWNKPGFLHAFGNAFQTKEVVFSAGQLYFCMNNINGNNGLQALTLSGDQKWTQPAGYQPAIGPDGRIYVITVQLTNSYAEIGSFDTQGNLIKKFFGTGTRSLTVPDVGSDGVFYVGQNFSTLVAENPNAVEKWSVAGHGILGGPIVSPTNKLIAVTGYELGKPGYVAGVSTNGKPKWLVNLPPENGGYVRPMSRPRFSADGSVVYVGMDVNDAAVDYYTYLYAFNAGALTITSFADGGDSENIIDAQSKFSKSGKPEVYPNPAANTLIADLTGLQGMVTLKLYDMHGKLIQVKKAAAQTQARLDIHLLASGLYTLVISDDKGNTQSINWIKE